MELSDALTVTFLGLGVVFSGLLLTALLITTFGLLNRMAETPAGRPARQQQADSATIQSPPEDPGVVAVIATVLEVERRLRRMEPAGRLTISRTG